MCAFGVMVSNHLAVAIHYLAFVLHVTLVRVLALCSQDSYVFMLDLC